MPRKIDSVPTAFSQLKLMLEACRIRKVLIAVTARSFHTVCYSCAKQASETGLPIVRPLVLLAQDDPNTFGVRHAYRFGDVFLVAPITAPNATQRQVYLPAGG